MTGPAPHTKEGLVSSSDEERNNAILTELAARNSTVVLLNLIANTARAAAPHKES